MKATFYGVRGSMPSPGTHTLRYGGNTTCLYLEMEDGAGLIIDAGSGLRLLGERLADSRDEIHMLLTHNHWDHVLGFPFFRPAYQAHRKINVYCDWPDEAHLPALLEQMRAPYFPVSHDNLRSDIRISRTRHGQTIEPMPGVKVLCQSLNHPDGGCAFRIESGGKKLVFATDNELAPPGDPITSYEEWVAFSRSCDLLIHDANYRADEITSKAGWGHSCFEDAVRLACDAGVKTLALFHHEIDRSDDELDEIGQQAIALADGCCTVVVAREGMTLEL